MPDDRLTQDAELMLCILYNAYVARRKEGMSRADARFFGSSRRIQEEFIQQWPIDDIDDAARELTRKGYFTFLPADNTVYAEAQLTPDGIVYMEHEFGDKFDKLTQRIAALKALIFG